MILQVCKRFRWWLLTGSVIAFLTLFPAILMLTIGRQHAEGSFDAVIVFGARVYADGTLSDALDDRIVAVCNLYLEGQCNALVLSGGPGDGSLTEARAMKLRAIELGVPEDALTLDEYGLNTAATCKNTARICRERGWTRVVGVSHFYHTPRIQMMLRRSGLDADTEPASMRNGALRALPYFMARECTAWWVDRLQLR